MIKVLHTSDLHLGYTSYLPVNDSHRLITLDKITSISRDYDILILCGDIFTGVTVKSDVVNQALKLLVNLADSGTSVIIVPSVQEIRFFEHLDHAKISICSEEYQKVSISESRPKITVHAGRIDSIQKLFDIGRADTGFQLGAFYTDVLVKPLNEEDFSPGLPLDFYALGGFHNFKVFRSGGNAFAAYSGSPETVFPGENRERYVVSYEIGGNSIEKMKRLSVNTLFYDRHVIDSTQFGSAEEIYTMIENLAGKNKILEIDLKGKNIFTENTDIKKLAGRFKLLLVHEDYDSSLMRLASRYTNEETLRGDFFRSLSASTGGLDSDRVYDTQFLYTILKSLDEEENITEEFLCGLFNV